MESPSSWSPKTKDAHVRLSRRDNFLNSFFVLIPVPVRISLERATAPSFGSRPSHFCVSARDDLSQHLFSSTTFRNVDSRASVSLTNVVCLFLFPN